MPPSEHERVQRLSEIFRACQPTSLELEVEHAIAQAVNAIAVDLDNGIIVLVTPPAEVLFGYEPGELKGHAVHDLVPEDVREQHERWFEQYSRSPTNRTMGSRGAVLRGRRKDGTEFAAEVGLAGPIDLGEMRLAIATVIPMASRHPRQPAES